MIIDRVDWRCTKWIESTIPLDSYVCDREPGERFVSARRAVSFCLFTLPCICYGLTTVSFTAAMLYRSWGTTSPSFSLIEQVLVSALFVLAALLLFGFVSFAHVSFVKVIMFATATSADLGISASHVARRWITSGIDYAASLTPRQIERTALLIAYLLPPGIRDDSFVTAFEEFREDFAVHRRRYRTRGARAWLAGCFLARVALLYLDCLRVWGLSTWVGPPTAKLWTRLLRGFLPLLIPWLWAALALLR